MTEKVVKTKVFRFDDINHSKSEVASVIEEARKFAYEKKGEIKAMPGIVSRDSKGEPYYNDPSCFPYYEVTYEESEENWQ